MLNWQLRFIDPHQVVMSEVTEALLVSGELIIQSGIYRVEHAGEQGTSEAVLIRGTRLPVCAECRQPLLFSLTRTIPHLSEDEDFSGSSSC